MKQCRFPLLYVLQKLRETDFRKEGAAAVPHLLASVILLGALVCGVALAFLIGQIKPLVRSKKNIEAITDFPVLGIITLIETPQSRALKHRGRIFQGVSLGGLFVVYAGIMTKYLMSAAQ